MIIFGFEVSAWRIFQIALLLIFLAVTFLKPYMPEGFQQQADGLHDRMITCPTLKSSIIYNTSLLEGYMDYEAVTSAKHTQNAIDHLNSAYKEHDCDSYITVEKEAEEEAAEEEATEEAE